MPESGATNAAAKAVQKSSHKPGVFRRLFELLMMLVSAIMVLFAWDTAQRAKQESEMLRSELERTRASQLDRSGTRCTVCLDAARDVLLQPCGHVATCHSCANRLVSADNSCPICREQITGIQKAYIS